MATKPKTAKKSVQSVEKTRPPEQMKKSISLYLFPQRQLEKSQKTYRGIAIATIAMLYLVLLFVGFVAFNFEVMFFPK